jgi:hypothetical protein
MIKRQTPAGRKTPIWSLWFHAATDALIKWQGMTEAERAEWFEDVEVLRNSVAVDRLTEQMDGTTDKDKRRQLEAMIEEQKRNPLGKQTI